MRENPEFLMGSAAMPRFPSKILGFISYVILRKMRKVLICCSAPRINPRISSKPDKTLQKNNLKGEFCGWRLATEPKLDRVD